MTISNHLFTIPPGDPRAVELFDLLGLQGVLMNQMGWPATVENMTATKAAFDLVNDEITELLTNYRLECGGDESCRVGLTYAANGYPVVDGRPCAPTLH
jgi:hypothetical protein